MYFFSFIVSALHSQVTVLQSQVRELQSQVNNIGKPVAGPVPTDCNGVKALGWTQSGYYTIKGSASQLKTVYCDFTKAPSIKGWMNDATHFFNRSINWQIHLYTFLRIRDDDWLQRYQNCGWCLLLRPGSQGLFIRCLGDSLWIGTIEYRWGNELTDGRLHCPCQRPISFHLHCAIDFIRSYG